MLVELTARFDEERNIRWARALEAAGAHVIYGVRGYKTHAKICLDRPRTPRGLRRYVHLGTGNYNERTARLYTDFGLLTTRRRRSPRTPSAFFNALTGYSDPPRLKKLVMAPTGPAPALRPADQARATPRRGRRAGRDRRQDELAHRRGDHRGALRRLASGVRIRLNVRGICALRPGVKGVSDNIDVISIVDRFLEHARIYYFLNGGDEQVYLASADWMTRNLDKRIELMFPIEDAGAQGDGPARPAGDVPRHGQGSPIRR